MYCDILTLYNLETNVYSNNKDKLFASANLDSIVTALIKL